MLWRRGIHWGVITQKSIQDRITKPTHLWNVSLQTIWTKHRGKMTGVVFLCVLLFTNIYNVSPRSRIDFHAQKLFILEMWIYPTLPQWSGIIWKYSICQCLYFVYILWLFLWALTHKQRQLLPTSRYVPMAPCVHTCSVHSCCIHTAGRLTEPGSLSLRYQQLLCELENVGECSFKKSFIRSCRVCHSL